VGAHVWGDDAAGLGEWGNVFLKEVMGTAPPGDQEQGATVADIFIVEPDPIIGRDGWHRETLLSAGHRKRSGGSPRPLGRLIGKRFSIIAHRRIVAIEHVGLIAHGRRRPGGRGECKPRHDFVYASAECSRLYRIAVSPQISTHDLSRVESFIMTLRGMVARRADVSRVQSSALRTSGKEIVTRFGEWG
jgi:hypothetical protein